MFIFFEQGQTSDTNDSCSIDGNNIQKRDFFGVNSKKVVYLQHIKLLYEKSNAYHTFYNHDFIRLRTGGLVRLRTLQGRQRTHHRQRRVSRGGVHGEFHHGILGALPPRVL